MEFHHSQSPNICLSQFCFSCAQHPSIGLFLSFWLFVTVLTSDLSFICLSTCSRLLIINDETCLKGELSIPHKIFALSPAKFTFEHLLNMVIHPPFCGILRVSSL